MGKKHKKESKKKKHRSRSRSNEKDVEKEKRKHHKRHHKDRKKEKSHKKPKSDISSLSDDDVIEVIDDGPPPPKISRGESPQRPATPPPPLIKGEQLAVPKEEKVKVEVMKEEVEAGAGDSLSIEETNRLRAKLGLKPLQVSTGSQDTVPKGTSDEDFIHKPAEDLTNKKVTEKLRAKLAERKEKREIERKLMKVKGLGEGESDDESAAAWVTKNRKLQRDKLLAEKKAKELDEMEEEFGIGELVQEELMKEKSLAYTSMDLHGLTVEHDINTFDEGKAVILTLKDKGVLDEDEDALVNVNMLDEERYKKNLFNKKQKPFGYTGVEEEEEADESSVLSKYDEEIEGEKKSKFKLGQTSGILSKEVIKEKLAKKAKMTLESLTLPQLKPAVDYFTEEEMKIKFKKPKKVRKVRKKLKAIDLLSSNGVVNGGSASSRDNGSRPKREHEIEEEDMKVKEEPMDVEEEDPMDFDDLPPPPNLDNMKLEVPEEESELELALKKARRLKKLEGKQAAPIMPLETLVKKEVEKEGQSLGYLGDEGPGGGGKIVLNSTAEFCRTLGDIPTYGLAGNRGEEAQGLLDFEKDLKNEKVRQEDNLDRGGWNDAEMDEKLVEIGKSETVILEAEPEVGAGVGGALRLAMSKGYLERGQQSRPSASRFPHLQAQNYSIEDKTHTDDDKFGRRERYMGPTSDFKEKDNYKPNIKLEYIDDEGHLLSAKEAFRYLSHKFHGKGPGKNKVEKRMKKGEQQVLMKQMSSTDTPLGTLQMLQQKQKETQSAFVVLSGSKHLPVPTSISKTKLMK